MPSFWDNAESPRLSSVRVSIGLSAPTSPSVDPLAAPPPGCTLFPHSNGSACGGGEPFSSAPYQFKTWEYSGTSMAISIGHGGFTVKEALTKIATTL